MLVLACMLCKSFQRQKSDDALREADQRGTQAAHLWQAVGGSRLKSICTGVTRDWSTSSDNQYGAFGVGADAVKLRHFAKDGGRWVDENVEEATDCA